MQVCGFIRTQTMALEPKKIDFNLLARQYVIYVAAADKIAMQDVTISPIFVKNALQGAIRKGYNAEEILRAQGLPTQILSSPKLRISTTDFAELSRTLTELLRDETLGLLAKPSQIGNFNLLARACISSRNIKESLAICRNYSNWTDDSISAFTLFDENGGCFAVDVDKAEDINNNYILESLLTLCHRFHCWLAGDFIPIERVELSYSEDEISDEHRFIFYGAPIHYNQKRNAIYFSPKTLALENQRNREDLRELFIRPHTRLLTQPKQTKSVSVKVRFWMEKLFREGGGLPQLKEASIYMEMSEQTLRRRLKEDAYSFNKLKEETRRDVAIYYIKQSSLSVEEIGFRLGFSEASTFIRAFKKWTELTPLAYRKL